MSLCELTETCVFFNDDVGYSPELQEQMRTTYCRGDNSDCARLRALDDMPRSAVPDDLIPTDHERLAELVERYLSGR